MIYAYRAKLSVKPGVDVTSPGFQTALENNRSAVKRRIAMFGGDPLPREQMVLRASSNGTIVLVWRSKVPPDRADLLNNIKEYAAGLTLISGWTLEYHKCGNGVGRPCGAWRTLISE